MHSNGLHQRPRHRRRCQVAGSQPPPDNRDPAARLSQAVLAQFIHFLPTPSAPRAWQQLCHKLAASGLAGLLTALDRNTAALPDVQGAAAAHCQLARHPWAHKFADPVLSAYAAQLFMHIVGILFHAAEYPAFDQQHFPVHLGYCQANSTLRFSQGSMDLRNILWWRGQLAVVDVSSSSPFSKLLLHEGTQPLRTLYEEDFGHPIADLLLLRQPRRKRRRLAAERVRLLRAMSAPSGLAEEALGLQSHVFVSY
eukprot:gene6337-6572_t